MATVLIGFLVSGLLGSGEPVAESSPTTAPKPVSLDMEGFDASHIIDDEVFYDSTAMTQAEVAEFIKTTNAGCQPGRDGTPCLAEAVFDTEDRDPTTFCPGRYAGGTSQSAAEVISGVAAACDVNPQVLLVLIQKEQGLLTATGSRLTARDYEAAAGYSCPDGAECDPQHAGFFRQVYGAASQFQRYRLNPVEYDVVAGQPAQVAYSPEPACGTSVLTTANQSTAGLYNYTPYQPNEAAGLGGDDCTSWGNWSFYGYFRTFFGDPTPSTGS